jgi:DNA-binding NarL/FixJ family response regulator
MRVLIVDERPSVRVALRAVLEHDPLCQGVDEVAEAEDAMTALAFGAGVVVLEWGLHGQLPEKLIAQMRVRQPGLVIIALGRFGDARQAALAAGCDYYIDTSEPAVDFVGVLHGLCPEIAATISQPADSPA